MRHGSKLFLALLVIAAVMALSVGFWFSRTMDRIQDSPINNRLGILNAR